MVRVRAILSVVEPRKGLAVVWTKADHGKWMRIGKYKKIEFNNTLQGT